ncbi:hypothetical protein [Gracilibacillus dipsosauri]|uniref:Uncharacterized protein n=1 Tax=Gracilibacillus dipsosauri TaxID=178340 RepID=A0A317L0F4_9BACI|nr:hypothetical protein [Gracilibacillus dipsosauri]PWU68318.1 hypothetical protein DLJ74_07655 [Gracilibacillus dipsosauri]
MKYILCQPAILRFKWELEVCITRLQKLGIQDIILLFTQGDADIPEYFKDMGCEVHVYPDNRTDKSYIPSIKPYLWMMYLEEDSSRENGSYFYLDSDVLLREIPKVRPTKKMWYASDCTGYIGNQYIDSKGDRLLEDMCRAIGIDHLFIRKKDPVGGAQWAIKNPSYAYWKKVYQDSITLYKLLDQSNTDIQKWTAEMWAQLWNVYHFGIDVKVPEEMNFSWPTDPVERYYETKIFHNAGVVDDHPSLFFKGKYVNHTPFEDDLSYVNQEKASIKYVEAIKEVRPLAKAKYIVLESFLDLEEDKEYEKDKPFPRPANKKIRQERLDALASSNNKAGRPLIKKIEE